MKSIKKILFLLIASAVSLNLATQNLSGVRIYINPGHGGYDSDDRNVVIAPYKSGEQNGFWESQSNLDKGQQLKTMLDASGATTFISRTVNTTASDLPLSQIVASANSVNADFMLSIHSNAGNGTGNSVLMLFAGKDANDTNSYATATPWSDKSRDISTVIAQNLYTNQLTNWSSGYSVRGDKTFGRTAMGWSDGYGVLRGLTVPGVISEGSMHDYIPETYRLMNMEYKYLEAWNFYKSFCTYFKSAQIPTGIIVGTVKDKFLLNETSYFKQGSDVYLPINGAKVTLLPDNISYTTDNLNNGVYLFKNLSAGNYQIVTEHANYHSDTTNVTVVANNVSYANIRLNKVRNTAPSVVDYSPHVTLNDSVLAGSFIRIKFNWDVDPTSAQQAFNISPTVAGKFIFEDANYTMKFIPDKPLSKSTIYTVTLSKSLRHYDGISMENDFLFQFKTAVRNELKLIASYPLADETNIDYQTPTFTFVFDKQLQTAELITGIQVFDKTGKVIEKGPRSLKHNTVKLPYGSTSFTLTQNLIPGEKYVVKLARGIQDVDGVFLPDTLKIPFTASNERNVNKTIVENFENSGKLIVDNTQNMYVSAASVSSSSSVKLFNNYSYNLTYNFSESYGSEVVYKFTTPFIQLKRDSVIGLHIFGDLSGNEIDMILSSTSGIQNVKLDSIHYGGWKFVEKRINSTSSEDQVFTLIGFKIVQKATPLSDKGNIFIDNLLVYDNALSDVKFPKARRTMLYPNPAKNTIYIKMDSNEQLKCCNIYDSTGSLLISSSRNAIDLSNVMSGIYIASITTDRGTYTEPFIVKQ